MVIPESCPACGSTRYKKNGHTRHGKQNHLCKNCERQFSAGAANRLIAAERRVEINNLLRERLSLRGICRAVGGSLTWLWHCMVECFATCPDHFHARLPARPAKGWVDQLEAEADARWSFVPKKAHKHWMWLAMDATTRQIMALHVGDRRRESARALWAAIPEVSHDHTKFHTDQDAVYKGVIPAERHKAITKKARKTNHSERFNNPLRQRLSRLVRDTLSFSKKGENPIGAIKCFMCHDNLEKAAVLPV
jgi:insertion element IS1 protein InsB